MSFRTLLVRIFTAMVALAVCLTAVSHEGPEHEIEELTDRIAKEGESADLLLQRAIEYQVLGKYAEAAKDLERALQFEAHLTTAQRELSRAYVALGKTNEALRTVTRALKTASEGPDHASLLIVRAEVLRARREHQKALEDTEQAIQEYPGNVEWYLLRSQLQARLKLKKERIAGLEAGISETSSGVLEAEWVDALIDDEQHERANETIETELKNSRLQSSWLIRRARVRLANRKDAEAKADLEAALTELSRRIHVASPDASLLADRGLARELLGKKEEARKDYEQAQDKGFTDEWVRQRIRSLRGAKDADKD
ncbi:MAG: tetratricopeptide repeat protein [Verrucomicrobiales bacterium]|nr:tetratricopeptide repeat protein [Verrucomicrobiales bacterium]